MNISDFNLIEFKQADWVVKQGKFSTWKVDNIYWHRPHRFSMKKQPVSIFVSNISGVPQKKIWYLVGLRQHLWRRYTKIKGFIPFIGIDIVNARLIFVFFHVVTTAPNLNFVLQTFLESADHKKLLSIVYR